MNKELEKIANQLHRYCVFRFETPEGTEIEFIVPRSRPWICCGGQIYAAPAETLTNGVVCCSMQSLFFHFGKFRFFNGKVVNFDCIKNKEYLEKMLDQDEGARTVGKLSFSLNDGTFHFALGNSYFNTKGTNKSNLYWDMVVDLKNGGKIYADQELIYENGNFLKLWKK